MKGNYERLASPIFDITWDVKVPYRMLVTVQEYDDPVNAYEKPVNVGHHLNRYNACEVMEEGGVGEAEIIAMLNGATAITESMEKEMDEGDDLLQLASLPLSDIVEIVYLNGDITICNLEDVLPMYNYLSDFLNYLKNNQGYRSRHLEALPEEDMEKMRSTLRMLEPFSEIVKGDYGMPVGFSNLLRAIGGDLSSAPKPKSELKLTSTFASDFSGLNDLFGERNDTRRRPNT